MHKSLPFFISFSGSAAERPQDFFDGRNSNLFNATLSALLPAGDRSKTGQAFGVR